MALALTIAEVANGASGFVLEWNLSHKIAGRTGKDELDSWTFSLLHEVRVDGPRHGVVHPVSERVGTLDIWAP